MRLRSRPCSRPEFEYGKRNTTSTTTSARSTPPLAQPVPEGRAMLLPQRQALLTSVATGTFPCPALLLCGTYRILYVVDDTNRIVEVTTIRHRSDAYRT